MLHWRGPDAKKILHLKLKILLGQHSLLIKSNTKKKHTTDEIQMSEIHYNI